MAEQQTVCPACGHYNRSEARFCIKCGGDMSPALPAPSPIATSASALPAPGSAGIPGGASGGASTSKTVKEFCSNCGKEVPSGVRFCRSCGHAIAPVTGAAVTAPVTAPVAASGVAPAAPVAGRTASAPVVVATPVQPPPATVSAPRATISPYLLVLVTMLVGLGLGAILGSGMIMLNPQMFGLEPTAGALATPAVLPTTTPLPMDASLPTEPPLPATDIPAVLPVVTDVVTDVVAPPTASLPTEAPPVEALPTEVLPVDVPPATSEIQEDVPADATPDPGAVATDVPVVPAVDQTPVP